MFVSDIARSLSTIFLILFSSANLPVCLSQGYPCIETSDVADDFISMCCSNTRCQLSNVTQLTCGGLSPSKSTRSNCSDRLRYLFIYFIVINDVIITYVLPSGITPVTGPLDQHSVTVTEKLVR
jgi:hypothetical protein